MGVPIIGSPGFGKLTMAAPHEPDTYYVAMGPHALHSKDVHHLSNHDFVVIGPPHLIEASVTEALSIQKPVTNA